MLMYSPAAIEKAPASSPATPARTMIWLSASAPATPMTSDRLLTRPSLAPKTAARNVPERPPRCHASWPVPRPRLRLWRRGHLRPCSSRQMAACSRSSAAMDCRLGRQLVGVGASSSPSRAWTSSAHALVPSRRARKMIRRTRSARRAGRRHGRARLLEPRRPDLGVAPLVAGDALEGGGARRVLLDLCQLVVQDDRVAFELEVGEAALDLVGAQLRASLLHQPEG